MLLSIPLREMPAAARATMRKWSTVEKVALGAFVFWAVCGLAFAPFRVQPSHAYTWGLPEIIAAFVHLCLTWGDVVLIVLAAINMHLAAIRAWGRSDAVRWGAMVMIISGILEAVGTLTGYPFGPYVYTDAFGPRIFGILPFTIPLAWQIVLTGFLLGIRQFMPLASRYTEAAMVALLATFFDFILEPFAVYIKNYWIWLTPNVYMPGGIIIPSPGIPYSNYISWWCIAFAITLIAAPTTALRWGEMEVRPVIIIGLMLAIFGVTRLAHWI